MRKQSLVLAAVVLVMSSTAGSVLAAKPPQASTGIDLWGQPARSAEVLGRPLGRTIALFRSPRLAARLPTPTGLARPLAVVAAHLAGGPGRLVVSQTRRVATPAGPIYLVPTVRGWVCVQAPRFETCHKGLVRQGVTWTFISTQTGLDVIGIAADNVDGVALIYAKQHRRAELADNVFFVHRPISLTSIQHLPPLGTLAISYRGTRTQGRVALH